MVQSTTTNLRRRILTAARHLLIQEGVTRVSMRMIAREVGCSVGSLYSYFKDKDELVHSLIEEGFEMLILRAERLNGAFNDAVGRLRGFCKAYISFGIENPEYYEIMFTLNAERMARYPAEKYRRARRALEIIAEVVSDGIREGVFKRVDSYVSANLIWSYLHGVITLMHAKRIDHIIREEDFINTAVEQISTLHLKDLVVPA